MITTQKHMINKANAINKITKKYETDEYKNKIFKTVKIDKPKIDIKAEVIKKKSQLEKVEAEGRLKRTNHPYKRIIKEFDYDKKITNEKDLIVFRPDDEDRNVENFMKRQVEYKNEVKKQNEDLEKVYTKDAKDEHCKKFEYTQKYKYVVESNDDEETQGDNLRKDRIEHYEKQAEKNYNNNVSIIDDLLKDGIINEDLTNINFDKIDADALEQKLIEKFGKEEYLRMMNEM